MFDMEPSQVGKDKCVRRDAQLLAGPGANRGWVGNPHQVVMHEQRSAPGGQEIPGPVGFSLSQEVKTASVPNEPADQVQVDEFLQPVGEPVIKQLAMRGKHVGYPRLLELPRQLVRPGGDAMEMKNRASALRPGRQGS